MHLLPHHAAQLLRIDALPDTSYRVGGKVGDYPIAEAIHNEVLSLPIGSSMTIEQAEQVTQIVRHTRSLHR